MSEPVNGTRPSLYLPDRWHGSDNLQVDGEVDTRGGLTFTAWESGIGAVVTLDHEQVTRLYEHLADLLGKGTRDA